MQTGEDLEQVENKKRKNQRKPNDPDRKHRFCDPGACDYCEYYGDGDFFCDKYQEFVVCDWEQTSDYMICKRRRNNK